MRSLAGRTVVVTRPRDEADELRVSATQLFDASLTDELTEAHLRLGEGVVGQAASTRAPIQIPDLLLEGAYASSVREALVRAGHRALSV